MKGYRKTPPRFPAVDDAVKARGNVKAFCGTTEVSESAYYAMQCGRTQPTLGLIYQVMQYTGLSFDEAFGTPSY